MKTIVLQKPGLFEMIDTGEPTPPGPGEALVRVRRIGICGTDIHAFRGRQPFFTYPRILGHELGVEIEAIADNNRGLVPGDRCAVEPYLNCGACIACRRQRPNCCASLRVLGVHADGGMCERIVVPIDKLHRSRTLSLEQLALVETLGIGAHAVARGQPETGEAALVVGSGPIGLSVIQFLKAAGTNVVVMDINPRRLAFCREQFGVAHTIDASSGDPAQLLTATLDGDLPTLVFDATGNPHSMHKAFELVAPGGRLVFVGLFIGDVTFNDPDFHRRELTLLATRNSTPADFRRIIAMMEDGTIRTDPWLTHRARFGQMIDAFPTWLDPEAGVIKAVVEM